MLGQFAIVCATTLALTVSSEAALLGLTLQPFPDINSAFLNVNYNAGTDAFSASGFALAMNDDGIPPAVAITGGTFAINATIDGAGSASSGSLTINGTAGIFGPTLLTGSLTAFGWSPVGLFEFIFTVTGGSLAIPTYYGNPGASIGVILDAGGNNFTGDWSLSFNNFGQGVSDTAPIPAPATLPLLLAAFCVGRRRRDASSM